MFQLARLPSSNFLHAVADSEATRYPSGLTSLFYATNRWRCYLLSLRLEKVV